MFCWIQGHKWRYVTDELVFNCIKFSEDDYPLTRTNLLTKYSVLNTNVLVQCSKCKKTSKKVHWLYVSPDKLKEMYNG